MSVTISVGRDIFEIGAAEFLKSWFSTIFIRLENEKWGSKYPTVMKEFYSGNLSHANAEKAKKEVEEIRKELINLSPEKIVWDFENRLAAPPWGRDISPSITSLSNYFVTSDGKDLFDVILKALESAIKHKKSIVIE